MNGIHDMGGMDGFGAVVSEEHEPVFHARWEARVFAIASTLLRARLANVDEFRHAIERIPPDQYLASSYYERWMRAVQTLLVEKGALSREALISSHALSENAAQAPAPAEVAPVKSSARRMKAKYRAGAHVRARNLNPAGHTRLPRYVRGRTGVIHRDLGVFVFPDTNAHRAGENPQHVYSVEFDARELWGKREGARVYVDLWEDYLEPAPPRPRVSALATRNRRGSR
jgi:nitrile hydratase subunit beta